MLIAEKLVAAARDLLAIQTQKLAELDSAPVYMTGTRMEHTFKKMDIEAALNRLTIGHIGAVKPKVLSWIIQHAVEMEKANVGTI